MLLNCVNIFFLSLNYVSIHAKFLTHDFTKYFYVHLCNTRIMKFSITHLVEKTFINNTLLLPRMIFAKILSQNNVCN